MSIPQYSQYTHVTDPAWQYRSCGIVALLMVMEHVAQKYVATPDALIEEGLAIGAYKEGVGWFHKGLAALAERHGFHALNFDWSARSHSEAISLLSRHLSHSPVIASVTNAQGGHLVVLESLSATEAVIHDPENKEGALTHWSRDEFDTRWTRRIIVVSLDPIPTRDTHTTESPM